MKILIVGPVPPELGSKKSGGVESHVWALAQALTARSHHVDIGVTGRYFKRYQQINNIQLFGIIVSPSIIIKTFRSLIKMLLSAHPHGNLYSFSYSMYTLLLINGIRDISSYDIIHIHHLYHQASFCFRYLGISSPIIATIHSYHSILFDDSTNRGKKVKRISYLMSFLDSIIHVSETDKVKGKNLGVHWSCSDHVVHNGIMPLKQEYYSPYKERSGICFVGEINTRKAPEELIAAWSFVDISKTGHLKLIGEGLLLNKMRRAHSQSNSIHLHGFKPMAKVFDLMAQSLALVVPSRSESFGLVYLEALLLGTPVVGYHKIIVEHRRVLELTKEEQEYLLPIDIDRTTPQELTVAIHRAAQTRLDDLDGRIAEAIKTKIIDRYGWDTIIRQIESVYQEVISKAAGRREINE